MKKKGKSKSKKGIKTILYVKDHKCHACGMRGFDFINWHTQIVYKDGTNNQVSESEPFWDRQWERAYSN